MARGKEGLMDIRVHIYHQVLLDRNFPVSILNGRFDPFCEGISSDRIGDVHHPLFWKFESLLLNREVVDDLGIVLEELTYVRQEEAFVSVSIMVKICKQIWYLLRDLEVLDVLLLDVALCP